MNLKTIGKNIRKYRKEKDIRQDKLAEMADLSTNYIGMIERGEKIPSLETFLKICKALDVSADMLLADTNYNGYRVKDSILSDKLNTLPEDERNKIYEIIDVMIDK